MRQLYIVSYFDFRRIAIYCLTNGRATSLVHGMRALLSFISTKRARVFCEENILFDVSHSYLTSSQLVAFFHDVRRVPPSFCSSKYAGFLSHNYKTLPRLQDFDTLLCFFPSACLSYFALRYLYVSDRMISLENKMSAKKNRETRQESRRILH